MTSDREDDERQLTFMKALLEDLRALETMLERDLFETGKRRIGAEQEMFLIDDAMRPAPVADEVLERVDDERLTTELARFNLEANLTPRDFGGTCLSETEGELEEVVELTRRAAAQSGAEVVLAGILPTLRKSDLGVENMTPKERYHNIARATRKMRGGGFDVHIEGIDELHAHHDNVMMESCNTSFQIHFQVSPDEFANLYNTAQAVTAPVLAAAVNSPVFLGRRLWKETRIALFERSVDARSEALMARGLPPRVSFGDGWVRESVAEIFREQIARFRVVLPAEIEEHPLEALERGEVPPLSALRLHNGTVYRWNRACYGMSGGVPHLRIENRALPAGPTIADEVANAAFFYGLMSAFLEHENIAEVMSFDDAKENFLCAARDGLKAQFTWLDGKAHAAGELITNRLLPMAREGLEHSSVDSDDIKRYLGILEKRVSTGQTGSRWAFKSLAGMNGGATQEIRDRSLVASALEQQKSGRPISEWTLSELQEDTTWRQSYKTIGQFMSTDLFTVGPGDLVDLAANIMDWKRIQHIPVEDDQGNLVGLVSYRNILRLVARGEIGDDPIAVRDIMKPNPVTADPDTTTLDAMLMMRSHQVGCLPVLEGDKLVGIITQSDLITVSAGLLERYLEQE